MTTTVELNFLNEKIMSIVLHCYPLSWYCSQYLSTIPFIPSLWSWSKFNRWTSLSKLKLPYYFDQLNEILVGKNPSLKIWWNNPSLKFELSLILCHRISVHLIAFIITKVYKNFNELRENLF